MRVLILSGSFQGYEATLVAIDPLRGLLTVRMDHLGGTYRTFARGELKAR